MKNIYNAPNKEAAAAALEDLAAKWDPSTPMPCRAGETTEKNL